MVLFVGRYKIVVLLWAKQVLGGRLYYDCRLINNSFEDGILWAHMKSFWIWLVSMIVLSGVVHGQGQNPFDLVRSADDSTTSTVVTPEVDNKLDAENPFDVSHIPIRKNQYKEIERMALPKEEKARTISLSYLPLQIIVLSMCFLAYLLYMKRDHLAVLIKSISNDNFMKLSNYEEKGGLNVIYLLGYLLFILNAALLIYLVCTKQFGYSRPYLYLILVGCVAGFFLGKHVVNTVVSWVFHLSKESKLYDFTIITFYNLLGLVFFIINILMVFGSQGWVRALASFASLIFIIFLLSRYYKALIIGRSQANAYFFHFFLYFCAFEFCPWVVVYTVLKDLI